jgi:hypoxanthine-DNA glycosylase
MDKKYMLLFNGDAMALVKHPFPPLYDGDCTALVLGTMPSPVSRANVFYYGHPGNRFWPVLAAVFDAPPPETNAERTCLALRYHIALWDVLASCEIDGASDGSIRNPAANDFSTLLRETKIERIFTTGKKAFDLYRALCEEKTGIAAVPLPSTSPANQRFSFEALTAAYRPALLGLRELEAVRMN